MNRRSGLPIFACALLGVAQIAACDFIEDRELDRMKHQARYAPYAKSAFFSDGRAMRSPPAGTVRVGEQLGDSALTLGVVADTFVDRVPVPIDRARLERGRDRFAIFCAPCHGLAGDGVSEVAHNMDLRPPPSLVTPPLAAAPPGRIYRAIHDGYGLMPSYRAQLALEDRWAVVAYVEALQLSRAVRLDTLPAPLRREAQEHLR